MKILLIFSILLINCTKIKFNLYNKQKGILEDLKLKIKDNNKLDLIRYFFQKDKRELFKIHDEENRNIFMVILSSPEFSSQDKEIIFLYLIERFMFYSYEQKFNERVFREEILYEINKQDFYRNISGKYIRIINSLKNNNNNNNVNNLELLYSIDNIEECFKHRDLNGRNLIFYALEISSEILINFLIKAGIDIEVIDGKGITPLAFCIAQRSMLLSYLMNGNDEYKFSINYPNTKRASSPLAIAASLGNETALSLLLKHGADPDSGDDNNNKAIVLAAHYGHEKIVKILLAAGAKHLTGEKIKKRKLKKIAQKVGGPIAQLGIDGLLLGAGSPVSPSISGFIGMLGNKHTIQHTECYEIVNEIFKEGSWFFEYKNNYLTDKALDLGLKIEEYCKDWKKPEDTKKAGKLKKFLLKIRLDNKDSDFFEKIMEKYSEYKGSKRKVFTSDYKKTKIIKRLVLLKDEISDYQEFNLFLKEEIQNINPLKNLKIELISLVESCDTLIDEEILEFQNEIKEFNSKIKKFEKDKDKKIRFSVDDHLVLSLQLSNIIKSKGEIEKKYENIVKEFNKIKCKIK